VAVANLSQNYQTQKTMNETLTKFRQVVADTAELQKEVKAGAD